MKIISGKCNSGKTTELCKLVSKFSGRNLIITMDHPKRILEEVVRNNPAFEGEISCQTPNGFLRDVKGHIDIYDNIFVDDALDLLSLLKVRAVTVSENIDRVNIGDENE